MDKYSEQKSIKKHKKPKNIVVGISGASGSSFIADFCSVLQSVNYNPIVVLTNAAEKVAGLESKSLLDYRLRKSKIEYYNQDEIGASVASGSFETSGMVVYCSINTLSKIACGITDNLLIRAADVTLKEGRPLILIVRETPFHLGHLKTMTKVCEMGAIIMPLIFSFYSNEKLTVRRCFKQFYGRVLDRLGIKNNFVKRWKG